MNDWPHATIGEVAEVFDGPHATPKTVSEGPIFLGISSLNNGRIDLGETRHVSLEDFKTWTRRVKPMRDDVVFSYETRLGEAAIIPDGLECCLGRRMGLVRTDRKRLHPRFFLYYYLSPAFQDFLRSRTIRGATVDRIALKEFPSFPVPVPPLDEQLEIAQLLGSLDDKIELNRRMNETLEAMAQAIFRDWFVDFGPIQRKLDGVTDPVEIMGGVVADADRAQELANLFPARLGDNGLPEGWRDGTLGDLVASVVERCEPSAETEARPYVPIDTIAAKSLIIKSVRPGSEAQSSLVKFRRGDILFGAMRPYFHKVALADLDGTTRTTVFVLRPKRNVDLYFSLMVVNEDATIAYATQHSSGTTIPYAVWRNSLERMPVRYPPLDIRAAYGSVVEAMLSRMQASASQNEAIAMTRNLLLPKLMSGEVRLSDAEAVFEAAQ